MKNFWKILCLASFFMPCVAWGSVPVQAAVIGEEDIVSLRNDEHPEFFLMEGTIPDHQEFFEVIDIVEGEDEVTHIPLWEIIVHYRRSSNAPSSIDLDDLLVEYVFHIIIADRVHLTQLEETPNSDSDLELVMQ